MMSQLQSTKENVSPSTPLVETIYKDQNEGIAFLENVIKDWAEKYGKLEREHQNLRKERDDVENSNQEIRRESARVKTQLDLLQQKYKQDNERFLEANKGLNIQVETVRQELRSKNTENGDLQRELVENKMKVEALEEKLEMKEKELENIKRILELNRRGAEFNSNEAGVQTYPDSDNEDDPLLRGTDHQDIALAKEINRKLAEDNEILRSKIEELRKERDDALNKNQEIMEENAGIKQIMKQLQCKSDDYEVQKKNLMELENNQNTGLGVGVERRAWSFGHMVLLLLVRTAVHMTS